MKKYIINLQDATGRIEHVRKQLAGTTFSDAERFDAFDARKLSESELRQIFDYKEFERRHNRLPGRGEVGCFMSHQTLWKKCAESGKPILILEDDLKRVRDFSAEELAAAENWLETDKPRILILQDFYTSVNLKKTIGAGVKIVHPYLIECAHAYIINQAAAQILSNLKPDTVADDWPLFKQASIEVAAVTPPVFSQNSDFDSFIKNDLVRRRPPLHIRVRYKLKNLLEPILASIGLLIRC